MVAQAMPEAPETANISPQKKGARTARVRFFPSLVQRAKAKVLYVIERLPPKEIEERTGIPARSLHNIAHREKWVAAKRRAKEKAEFQALEMSKEQIDAVAQGSAIQCDSLSLGTLSACEEVLEKKSGDFWAKDLQSLSQAAKNFVGIARQARGLDTAENASDSKTNIIFLNLERVGDTPRNEKVVTEIHELNTTETPTEKPSPIAELEDNGAF